MCCIATQPTRLNSAEFNFSAEFNRLFFGWLNSGEISEKNRLFSVEFTWIHQKSSKKCSYRMTLMSIFLLVGSVSLDLSKSESNWSSAIIMQKRVWRRTCLNNSSTDDYRNLLLPLSYWKRSNFICYANGWSWSLTEPLRSNVSDHCCCACKARKFWLHPQKSSV